jgi:hypothetical protein
VSAPSLGVARAELFVQRFEALLSAIFVAQRLDYRSMAVFGSSKVPSDVRDALEIRKSH